MHVSSTFHSLDHLRMLLWKSKPIVILLRLNFVVYSSCNLWVLEFYEHFLKINIAVALDFIAFKMIKVKCSYNNNQSELLIWQLKWVVIFRLLELHLCIEVMEWLITAATVDLWAVNTRTPLAVYLQVHLHALSQYLFFLLNVSPFSHIFIHFQQK